MNNFDDCYLLERFETYIKAFASGQGCCWVGTFVERVPLAFESIFAIATASCRGENWSTNGRDFAIVKLTNTSNVGNLKNEKK